MDGEHRASEAERRLRAVVSRVEENSSIRFMALLNLGTLLDNNEAIDIYTEVIESNFSDDETRACALNNRAYIYQGREDYFAAIKDREHVLTLSNTSSDRRFVALFGCGESHFLLGMFDKVIQDMTTIIESSDIIPIDKICALVCRSVGYYFKGEVQASSLEDLQLAVQKLIRFVTHEDLQSKLLDALSLKDWDKSIQLVQDDEKAPDKDAIELLRTIYPFVIALSSNNDNFQDRGRWDELRKMIISKARRLRVHNPNIAM
jgi:tetratricopeptide (TPR) repeat protein